VSSSCIKQAFSTKQALYYLVSVHEGFFPAGNELTVGDSWKIAIEHNFWNGQNKPLVFSICHTYLLWAWWNV